MAPRAAVVQRLIECESVSAIVGAPNGGKTALAVDLAAYVAAGAQKFILRPMARDDEGMMAQTRRVIEEVLPAVAALYPKQPKAA